MNWTRQVHQDQAHLIQSAAADQLNPREIDPWTNISLQSETNNVYIFSSKFRHFQSVSEQEYVGPKGLQDSPAPLLKMIQMAQSFDWPVEDLSVALQVKLGVGSL